MSQYPTADSVIELLNIIAMAVTDIYTAESALFVRRALVAFLGILLLTGVLIANLYNLQIVRFTDYQTRSNENRIKLVPIAPSPLITADKVIYYCLTHSRAACMFRKCAR